MICVIFGLQYPEGYDPNKEKEKKGGKRKRDSEEGSIFKFLISPSGT